MNHYATLGVARRASTDEIRAAYRRAARDAHPDRHGEASANRMAVVNEAWRVLGDPGRRQRYDLELDGAGLDRAGLDGPGLDGPGLDGTGRPVAGSAVRSSSPSVTREQPAPMPTGDMSRFPWRLFAILLVVGVVVVFVGNTMTDPPPPAPIDNALEPGECVVFGDQIDEIIPAVCDGSHDAVVVAVGERDATRCPTGSSGRRDPLRGDVACVEPVASPGG